MIGQLLKEGMRGKTIGRILFNLEIKKYCHDVDGQILDLAGGSNPSYYSYLKKKPAVVSDYIKKDHGGVVVDLNEPLPFRSETFDAVFLFNAIYILKNRVASLEEVLRVLKQGGTLYLSSPFSNIETPEPDDFGRLTEQGLRVEFAKAGFTDVKIERYGERFTSAANLLHPFMLLNLIRTIIYMIACGLDKLIPLSLRKRHPAPLGYFCIAKK